MEGFFGGESDEIRIIVFLGDVSKNEMADAGIEAFRIRKKFTDGVIGKVTGAGEYALLDDPGVGADF